MSLRWKLMLTFLVVIGASFAIMASILTGMVSSTLYQQRTRQATRSLEQLASSAAPFLASAQMDSLSELLTAQAGELGGRLLAVDMDGKVQADTSAQGAGSGSVSRRRSPSSCTGRNPRSAFTASIRNRVRRMWRSRLP